MEHAVDRSKSIKSPIDRHLHRDRIGDISGNDLDLAAQLFEPRQGGAAMRHREAAIVVNVEAAWRDTSGGERLAGGDQPGVSRTGVGSVRECGDEFETGTLQYL